MTGIVYFDSSIKGFGYGIEILHAIGIRLDTICSYLIFGFISVPRTFGIVC